MHTSISITACAVILASLVQYCPAPPLAAIIGVTTGELLTAGTTLAGSAIAAGAGASSKSRSVKRDIPAGVSQESAEQCASELAGVNIVFTAQDNNGLLVENMPPACMDLATVITGDYDGGNPIPMSSSSILFQSLTTDQLNQIQDALNGNY